MSNTKNSAILTKLVIEIKYVIDTWAWVEYFVASPSGIKVKEIVENESNEIYINSIIMAEVISKFSRENMDVNNAFEVISSLSKMTDISDTSFSKDAGVLYAQMRQKMKDFGLADAFILASARKINARIVTGDPHFKNIREAIMI